MVKGFLAGAICAGAFALGFLLGKPSDPIQDALEELGDDDMDLGQDEDPGVTPHELFVMLHDVGCQLIRTEKATLAVRDPNGVITESGYALLNQHGADLMALLQEQEGPTDYHVILCHDSDGILHAVEAQVVQRGAMLIPEVQIHRLTTEGRAERVQ